MLQRTAPRISAETAKRLEEDLRRQVRGEVRFDSGSRALYATDGSNYRQVPIGVVIPRTLDDVVATLAACRRHGAPVLSRGGGTSLAGQCCNVAVVIDFSKYCDRILELDPDARQARVEPGVILDSLRDAAEKHHLTFGPDPATHTHNCLGGMLGNNSCGPHSVMAGRTADNVVDMEILTYDGLRMTVGPTGEEELEANIRSAGRRGEIYAGLKEIRDRYGDLIRQRYPDIPRRVSGYNLDELLPEKGFNVARALVGSEGTCVTILNATLQLVPSPPGRALLVLGYPDIAAAGDHVPDVMATGPIACEAIDDLLIRFLRRKDKMEEEIAMLPEGEGWMLVEYGGADQEDARQNAEAAMERLRAGRNSPSMKLLSEPERQKKIWEVRESGLAATAWVPDMAATWPGWEDSAVPPDKVGPYLRDFRRKLDEYGYACALYGHFGQGCIHVRIDFDLQTRPGIDKYLRFVGEMADIVHSYGGSLSGEHGDGQSRAQLLPKMYGEELMEAMRAFKRLWDPEGKMNPGKVVDPYPIDANLRLGTEFRPREPHTEFALRQDKGSFVHAAMRCVGVGKCRKLGGQVMCPSFMATREEKHSTRGRAHLLFEMMHGGVITDGFRSHEVHDALDLCLACKGCKKDCPVNVDMATYKAEFHAHYYRNRLRPRAAYSMGLIHWWSRAASYVPSAANFVTQTPGLSTAVKWAGGIHRDRRFPRYAGQSWQERYARRGVRNQGKPRLAMFPDTFNNYFHPDTGMHAVEVLEAAGYQVEMPTRPVCCGRPLYVWGMLDLARGNLRNLMEVYAPYLRDGLPIVGLEPGCVTTLVDELPSLFPGDDRAHHIAAAARMFEDFLVDEAGWTPPSLKRRALYHPHCYQHAVLGTKGLQALMERMGLDYEMSDAGCCGMAGSFGFEEDHYDVSIKAGERKLLPMVRQRLPDDLIVSDGYSCREQIGQCTNRDALHLADVVHMAMRGQA